MWSFSHLNGAMNSCNFKSAMETNVGSGIVETRADWSSSSICRWSRDGARLLEANV